MSDHDNNELPPDSVSTQQLLMMVRSLGWQQQQIIKQQVAMNEQLELITKAFETGQAAVKLLKWIAAIVTAIIAIWAGIKGLAS